MGEINPLGSEKLGADEKLRRIIELSKYQTPAYTKSRANVNLVEEVNGHVYGIVKEKDGYYVKSGINESSLDYIGGLFMKNKNRFSSYGDAYKRLDYLKGQEVLSEATKYVLKGSAPMPPPAPVETPEPTPMPAPATDEPIDDLGGEIPADNEDIVDPESDVDGEGSEALKEVQKLTGKLCQKIREMGEELEGDDIKYTINMVLSSVDLDKLGDEDKDDIVDKIEGEEELEGEEGLDGLDDSEFEEPSSDVGDEMDVDEMDDSVIKSLEEFIATPWDLDDDDTEGRTEDDVVNIPNEIDEDDFLYENVNKSKKVTKKTKK